MKNTTAKNITVINDGQVRYPVLTSSLDAWIAQRGEITASNYDKFCSDVECIGESEFGTPGSAAMIEYCAKLVDAGAATKSF